MHMSKNRNRAFLSKANDGTTYHRLLIKHLNPPYDETGWNWNHDVGLSNKKWREYRTWKYNRKTKYKLK